MSERKESRIKRMIYRRGGQEPDPPKIRHQKRDKPFKLECYYRDTILFRKGWYGLGKYHILADAERAFEAALHPGYGIQLFLRLRIIDTRTSSIITEKEILQ